MGVPVSLMKAPGPYSVAFLQSFIEEIKTLFEVEYVSFWKYDHASKYLVQVPANPQDSNTQLYCPDYPQYFDSILHQSLIDADQAQSDPRTIELNDAYLNPMNIHSLMDIQVPMEGKLYGILCIESKSERNWTDAEKKTAASLAGILSRALLSEKQKETEEKLRHSQTIFEKFADNIPGMAFIKNADGPHLFGNKKLLEYFGIDLETYQKSTLEQLLEKDHQELAKASDLEVLRQQRSIQREFEYHNRWFQEIKFPIMDDLIGGIDLDITTRIEAMQGLVASESRYRQMFEKNSAITLIIEWENGKIIQANDAALSF
jgi:PAS domain-containing protein